MSRVERFGRALEKPAVFMPLILLAGCGVLWLQITLITDILEEFAAWRARQ